MAVDVLAHEEPKRDRDVTTTLTAWCRRVTEDVVHDFPNNGLPERFVLFLGALEPRKNLPRLLEAYAALPPALRRDVHLVVAGMRGWLNDSVHAHVRALGLEATVHFAGYIDGEDLAAVYSLATLFGLRPAGAGGDGVRNRGPDLGRLVVAGGGGGRGGASRAH